MIIFPQCPRHKTEHQRVLLVSISDPMLVPHIAWLLGMMYMTDDSDHSADEAHSHSVVTNIVEKLLCARLCARYKRDSSESTAKVPVLAGFTF